MQFSSRDTELAGKKYGATRSTTIPRSTSRKPERACMKYEGDGDMLRSFTLEEFKVIWRVYDGLFIFKKVEKLKNEEIDRLGIWLKFLHYPPSDIERFYAFFAEDLPFGNTVVILVDSTRRRRKLIAVIRTVCFLLKVSSN
ncbi:hypothetical protein MMC22_002503 [Lobaria immixta]|nr:hypothetical protein [Lobaria immixta]